MHREQGFTEEAGTWDAGGFDDAAYRGEHRLGIIMTMKLYEILSSQLDEHDSELLSSMKFGKLLRPSVSCSSK